MSKYCARLYKKYAVKMKVCAKKLFIALELELDRLVKQHYRSKGGNVKTADER